MAKRLRSEIVQAVRRVEAEGLLPIREAATILEVPPAVVQRWIIDGKAGIHLDGFHRPGETWYTSRAAIKRFKGTTPVATPCTPSLARILPSAAPDPALAVCERLAEEQVLPIERFADVLGLPSATPIARWTVLGVGAVKLDGVADSAAGFVTSAPALDRFHRELATTPPPAPDRKEGQHHGEAAT